MAYADNVATPKTDLQAFEAMKSLLLEDYSNPSQPYSFSRNSKKALHESRERIAACINAEPDETFFTSSGTESDNCAIKGSVDSVHNRREIITSKFEHHAVLRSCAAVERGGHPVRYLPITSEGIVASEIFEQFISEKTCLYQ